MADPHADQRLAAIMAADVAGYSRLMEADERATVATLDAYRVVFQEHAAGHGGRIVDTAGDSVLAVFASAIGAVEAAIAIQEELGNRNETLPEDQRMRFRLGVNLGDVIEKDDGSIYGSGVNVAARMESLAEPGGVCISGNVYDFVEGKVDLSLEDIGEQDVKNIARPVHAYRVGIGPAVTSSSDKPLVLPDKPSIAVLAFDNLSDDSEQEYFADGIAEDLITALSRIRWLFVIARNSAFAYKGQSPDVRQVGENLGVRYVLEGSVRKGGNRIRISAQLIDATTGNHVWAERYDRELADLFDLQDEITEAIAAAIEPAIGEAERDRAKRKPPHNLDAWESYQRGLWHMYQFTAQDNAAARDLFSRAMALDEQFAPPHGALAYVLYLDVLLGFARSREESVARAIAAGRAGVSIDDKDPMSHFGLGRALAMVGEHEATLAELDIAVELNPNFALAYLGLGVVRTAAGRPHESIEPLDTAIRLSPHDPILWTMENARAVAKIDTGQFEAAVEDARRACRHPNTGYWSYLSLASALAHLDRLDAARAALDKVIQVKPDFSSQTLLTSKMPSAVERSPNLQNGLRKAGLDIPEETPADD